MTATGLIWWNELRTTDEKGAIAFYRDLIGWQPFQVSAMDSLKAARDNEPVYTVWMMGWNQAGGMMKLRPGGLGGSSQWLPFIAVADVDECCERAAALGGEVVEAPFDVPNSGRFAVLRDPQGAVFGVGMPAEMEG